MEPSSLNENIVYLTGKLSKVFQQKMQQAFSEQGFKVTTEQFTILAHLWYRDGLRQQEIAEAIDRDKTTVSRVLDTMVKQNLIHRVPGEDKRERLIHLTKHGAAIRDQLVIISGDIYMKTLSEIDEPDIKTSIETLNKLIKNLE